jgi:ferric-dicitrate binding protein FerR (iron transport regulator)
VLVLYALEEGGHADLLTNGEQEVLRSAHEALERLFEAHPALRDVVAHIQREYDDFAATWSDFDPDELEAEAGIAEAPDEAGKRLPRTEGEQKDRVPQTPPRRTPRWWAWRIVGGALVVGAVIWGLLLVQRWPEQVTVSTGTDETERVALPDGSRATLVGNAEIKYNAAEDFEGTVELPYGRAFFTVAERDTQAGGARFTVTTPTAQAVATGTQFGVDVGNERTEVVVASGEVAVAGRAAPSNAAVALRAGQHSYVEPGDAPTPPEAVDLAQALRWADLMVLRDTPIEVAAAQVSKQYDQTLRVAAGLEGESVSVTLERDQPLTALAATLAQAVGGRVTTQDGGRTLVIVPQ